MVSLVWTGAIAGIVLRQVWLDAPQWAVAVPYVVVGWCSLIVAPQLFRALGGVGFALMLIAGVAYTAGALIYARKRPDPWPDVFGFHEVFHTCTVIGAGDLRLSRRLHRAARVAGGGRVREAGAGAWPGAGPNGCGA